MTWLLLEEVKRKSSTVLSPLHIPIISREHINPQYERKTINRLCFHCQREKHILFLVFIQMPEWILKVIWCYRDILDLLLEVRGSTSWSCADVIIQFVTSENWNQFSEHDIVEPAKHNKMLYRQSYEQGEIVSWGSFTYNASGTTGVSTFILQIINYSKVSGRLWLVAFQCDVTKRFLKRELSELLQSVFNCCLLTKSIQSLRLCWRFHCNWCCFTFRIHYWVVKKNMFW